MVLKSNWVTDICTLSSLVCGWLYSRKETLAKERSQVVQIRLVFGDKDSQLLNLSSAFARWGTCVVQHTRGSRIHNNLLKKCQGLSKPNFSPIPAYFPSML